MFISGYWIEKDKLPTLIPEKWLIDIIDSRLNNVNP